MFSLLFLSFSSELTVCCSHEMFLRHYWVKKIKQYHGEKLFRADIFFNLLPGGGFGGPGGGFFSTGSSSALRYFYLY